MSVGGCYFDLLIIINKGVGIIFTIEDKDLCLRRIDN